MRLHADARRSIETALRVALITVLAVSLWRALASSASGGKVGVAVSAFDRDASRLLRTGAARDVELTVDAAPSRAQRDLLAAVRRSGAEVRWRGEIPAFALEVSREREPFADGRIMAVGASSAPLVMTDSAGPLDSLPAGAGGTMEVGTLVGSVRATTGGFVARAAVPVPGVRRAVLILGRVGWEVKFVSAALTESGWTVRASSPAAPTVIVRDDAILPIDTARYDAVIALDSTAGEFAPAIAKFVAQGGGVIAAGSALHLQPLRTISPASAGEHKPARILLTQDTVTTRDLPNRALVSIRNDAVTLAREPQGVMAVAHRVGLGRALAIGYDETWRWRMLGGESGLALHREWWSHAVGAVAPSRDTTSRANDGDAAPRAAMLDAFGPAAAAPFRTIAIDRTNTLPFVLLVIVVVALLAETGSRRFRGAR